MRVFEAAHEALRTLRVSWVRTALTLFGIVWGTASVVFLISWGLGVRAMMEECYGRVGRNLVQVFPGQIGAEFTPAADRRELWFTLDDVAAVRERVRLSTLVLPESQAFREVGFRQTTTSLNIRGVVPENVALRGVRIAAGRPITRDDLSHRRRVAVLGTKARERLLGPHGGVGSTIRIAGRPFTVIGLLGRVGMQLWQDGPSSLDEQVWIPFSTLAGFGKRRGHDGEVVDNIMLSVLDRRTRKAAEREVRAILAERLRVSADDEEAIRIMSPLDALEKIPLDDMSGLLFALGATTLVIGGVGILTMMLDSVQQRRQEIGVRLAVGARRRDILTQFFLETFVITGLGGLLGIALGLAGCLALARLAAADLIPQPIVRWQTVAIALAVMTAVGFASGLVPARRAARVDPSLTLRTE
ncbi:MAG: ABC transporter permease [Thermodesulfobacteriota bacterium]